LVRERSRVRSSLAAPAKPFEGSNLLGFLAYLVITPVDRGQHQGGIPEMIGCTLP
jgi:hypothetical protein